MSPARISRNLSLAFYMLLRHLCSKPAQAASRASRTVQRSDRALAGKVRLHEVSRQEVGNRCSTNLEVQLQIRNFCAEGTGCLAVFPSGPAQDSTSWDNSAQACAGHGAPSQAPWMSITFLCFPGLQAPCLLQSFGMANRLCSAL